MKLQLSDLKMCHFLLAIGLLTSSGSAVAQNFSYEGINYNVIEGNEVEVVESDFSGDLVIPSSVSYEGVEYTVTQIASQAFRDCRTLISVTIPNSVSTIGIWAFYNCSSLLAINIESGNPNYADFDGVLYDKDMTTTIQCPGGKSSVSFPTTVTTIGYASFAECDHLKEIIIPESVTTIGANAFSDCSSLLYITLPDSLTTIGDGAFTYCDALPWINIPASVTSIGQAPFSGCVSLTLIGVNPENMNYLDISGVLYNKDITTLIQCPEAKNEVEIPEFVTTISDNAFYWCKYLTEIKIPASVTSIGTWAFEGCEALTEIIIPEGVESIETFTFEACYNLTQITIPSTVSKISDYAFSRCYVLSQINCFAINPPECSPYYVFDGVPASECTLFVPDESVEAYEETYPWNEFNVKGMSFSTNVNTLPAGEGDCYSVFDLNGLNILNTKDKDELSNLPPAIYIINNKKVKISK